MPGRFEIMRAIERGLNNLKIDTAATRSEWTKAVETELCRIGRKFGFKVYAKDPEEDEKDGGERLYDVTWLEYERHGSGELTDAPLVAECEWNDEESIEFDFEKLLRARVGVRVMIFGGGRESVKIAERLAVKVREFNGSRAEDTWLLAAWEQNGDAWRFRCSTIGRFSEAYVQKFPQREDGIESFR